jgi:chromosome partitioning protein
MTKIITLANFKGGVGKTTSAINIGAGLSNKGKRTLLIDLDPQFNLTQSLGVQEPEQTIYKALTNKEELQPIGITKKLDIIASSLDLIKAEIELSGEFKREFILSKLLEPIKANYEFIIIDCPPALGLLTLNSFVASDLIFIPIEAEYLALKGYSILREAIAKVGLEIDKVFITKFDSRKILNRNVAESIREGLNSKVFKTVIRDNIALAEAPAQGIDIFRYDSKSAGAQDYLNLCKEIIKEYK